MPAELEKKDEKNDVVEKDEKNDVVAKDATASVARTPTDGGGESAGDKGPAEGATESASAADASKSVAAAKAKAAMAPPPVPPSKVMKLERCESGSLDTASSAGGSVGKLSVRGRSVGESISDLLRSSMRHNPTILVQDVEVRLVT